MNQSPYLKIFLFVLFWRHTEPFVPFTTRKASRSSSLIMHADSTTSDSPLSTTSIISDCLFRGVEKMDKIMTPEFFLNSPSPTLQTMYSQCVKNVEIKESSISGAGLGLFAKKNIKSGTIVSFYPAHALGIDNNDNDNNNNNDNCIFFKCLPQDQDYFDVHPSATSSYLHCTDQPLFQRTSLLGQASPNLKDIPLYLDVNPNRPPILGDIWVSQMINDGATIESPSPTSSSEQGILDYYQRSSSMRNCIHIPWGPSPILATVTTKKVKKGQELFTTYGATYWLGVLDNSNSDNQVGITPSIQTHIQQTATDLLSSMKTVSVVYAQQAKAMQEAFDNL